MKGGFLRGQGTYGCVFQPTLLCRGSKNPKDADKVGKITSYQDAKNELEFGKYLHTVEGFDKYVITVDPKSCIPRAKSRQTDKDLDKCEFSQDLDLKTTVQIIMPWGGYSLNRVNLDPSNFDFFKFAEDMLAAAAFLTVNDTCHFDLSSLNVLMGSEKLPKIIDFGFAFRPSKIDLETLNFRWRVIDYEYNTETPEVTLMLVAHRDDSIEEAIQEMKMKKSILQGLHDICDVSRDTWANDLRQWSKTSQSFQQGDWLKCWQTYWPGFDSWGVGVILLNILEAQLHFHSFHTSSQWKTRGPLIKTVITGLCRAHPAYRIDCVEALNIFTNGKHPLILPPPSGADESYYNGYSWIQEKQVVRKSL